MKIIPYGGNIVFFDAVKHASERKQIDIHSYAILL